MHLDISCQGRHNVECCTCAILEWTSASEAVMADCGHASQRLSQIEHKDGLSREEMGRLVKRCTPLPGRATGRTSISFEVLNIL